MTVKNLLTVAAVSTALALAGIASGQKTFTGSTDNDWHTGSNWDPSGVPGVNDLVVIPSGKTPVISNSSAVADSIELQAASATLTITGQTLTLDGSSSSTSSVAGSVFLTNSTSVLKVTGNMTFAPYNPGGGDVYGAIVGQDPDAGLQIEEPSSGTRTLFFQITLEGTMVVEPVIVSGSGVAKLLIQKDSSDAASAYVHATGGPMVFDADLLFADAASGSDLPLYYAHGDVLQFGWRNDGQSPDASIHPELVGDFQVSHCGILKFDANVVTQGTFIDLFGDLQFTNGACFEWDLGSECDDTANCE